MTQCHKYLMTYVSENEYDYWINSSWNRERYFGIPGRGMCMPGKGTLNGGTMTGGNAGIAAAGWATAWGRPGGRLRGSKGTVCPVTVTVAVTVGTLTTATGVTPMLAGVVETTGGISDTTGATGNKKDVAANQCSGEYITVKGQLINTSQLQWKIKFYTIWLKSL